MEQMSVKKDGLPHDIGVIGRYIVKAVIEVFTDPEYKPAVRDVLTVNQNTVRNAGRRENHISELNRIDGVSHLHAHLPLQHEAEFVIIVGMRIYFYKVSIFIIIKFKIFGYHILPDIKRRSEFLFHFLILMIFAVVHK